MGHAAHCGRVCRPPSSAAGLITRDHGWKHSSIDGAHTHTRNWVRAASRARHCNRIVGGAARMMTAAPSEICEAVAGERCLQVTVFRRGDVWADSFVGFDETGRRGGRRNRQDAGLAAKLSVRC